MKNYTSRFLKTVALIYMAFPVVYISQAAVLFDVPFQNCLTVLLSPFYYILTALSIAVGYGLWEMKRWSWYSFVFLNVLIVYENALIVSQYSESHHKLLAFFASVLILWGIGYRISREVRVPYFFPKIRWWESNPRYKLSVPAKLQRQDGSLLEGQILDLSLNGCFIKLRSELIADEPLKIAFTIFEIPLQVDGIVVWKTQSTVTTPKGIGIKFCSLARSERRVLRQVTYRLRKINALYRRSRYLMNQEDFLKRLQELETRTPRRRLHVG